MKQSTASRGVKSKELVISGTAVKSFSEADSNITKNVEPEKLRFKFRLQHNHLEYYS